MLKFLLHQVQLPDLETGNRTCPRQNSEVNMVCFLSHEPSLSFPCFPDHSESWESQLHGRLSDTGVWSYPGFPFGFKIGVMDVSLISNNRRMFCSMEKVVEETGGQKVHTPKRNHDPEWVSVPATAGKVLRTLAGGRKTCLKLEPSARNRAQPLLDSWV